MSFQLSRAKKNLRRPQDTSSEATPRLVSLLSSPFSSAQGNLKNQPAGSKEKQNLL